MIRRAKTRQIEKKGEEEFLRIIVNRGKDELWKAREKERSVGTYLFTLVSSRDEIKTVLGDEAHLAEHAHLAEKFSDEDMDLH